MTRYADTLVLVSKEPVQDSEGGFSWRDSSEEVFFNRMRLSLDQRMAGKAEGLYGMVRGQVRSCDYSGQQAAVVGGEEYDVADAEDRGEFTVLTLSRRLSNV